MRLPFLSLLALLCYCLTSTAQKGQPSFGKVDKADLLMKDCDFDPGAEAMILIDYGNIYYDRGTVGYSVFKTIMENRVRIKILKEKGFRHADIQIPYYTHNNEEKIAKLQANTYNLDESGKVITSEVKKSSIYSKKIDGNYSMMIFTFPDVKVGSIIEYSYTSERETLDLSDWTFQDRIPVRYSEYQLKIPQIFRFSVQPSNVDPIEQKHDVITESISMDEGFIETKVLKSNYIMRNLKGVKDEPYMGSAKDYMQRIDFQMTQLHYSDTRIIDISVKWSDLIKNALKNSSDFGRQLEKVVPASKSFVEEAKLIADPEARIKFIYNGLRKNMSWNGNESYVYTDAGINKAWESKTGNVADINLLLVKLLNDAGIKASPILFSTREHGLVAPDNPYIGQFNTVMAFVGLNDKVFVLDATDKLINYKMVPEKVANTNGFIIEGEQGRWKEILSGKNRIRTSAAVQGQIDEEGKMKGAGWVNSYEYERARRADEWVSDKQKFKDEYFIKTYPALQIEEIAVENLEADSLPLEQKVKFSSVLNSSGDYKYFTLNLFSGLEKNPFIADNRISDIDFGVEQHYTVFGNYTIPAGYTFDGLPENISLSTSDNGIQFNRTVSVDANLLNVRMTLEFKRSFYPAATYGEFREFYKKLFDKLNEQVVIKKKAMP